MPGLLGTSLNTDDILETLRGIGRGLNFGGTSGMIGAPVDMATAVLNNPGLLHPGLLGVHGLGIKDPVGGSKWIEQKLQNQGLLPQRQGNWQEGVGELASTFINPMTAAAVAGPKLYAIESQMLDNAMAPTTLNKQAGMINLPYGKIPENADDLAALTGKQWFEPTNMTKKVQSEAKASAARQTYLDAFVKNNNWADSFQSASQRQQERALVSLDYATKVSPKKYLSDIPVTPEQQAKKYLNDVVDAFPGIKSSVHKNENLQFKSIPISEFDGASIYKSPSYNGRQSSEYKLIMQDGQPAYARKSDHFGKFSTNIYENSPEAIAQGLTNDHFDPFGRVGRTPHNWELIGDTSKTKSKAGAISLRDLLENGLLGFPQR